MTAEKSSNAMPGKGGQVVGGTDGVGRAENRRWGSRDVAHLNPLAREIQRNKMNFMNGSSGLYTCIYIYIFYITYIIIYTYMCV